MGLSFIPFPAPDGPQSPQDAPQEAQDPNLDLLPAPLNLNSSETILSGPDGYSGPEQDPPDPLSSLSPIPTLLKVAPDPHQGQAIYLNNQAALTRLIELILERSGLTQAEISRRLDIRPQSLGQYVKANRVPTLGWIARLSQVCGAKLTLEFPTLDPPIVMKFSRADL